MYRVLVVDDEKMIRMGIKNGLPWESLGIDEVYAAASAREALEIIEAHHPQIMVTDISMTEMTGLDLIERMREKDQDMRILVLTGYDRFDYARQCLQMRVQNFLLKPIDEQVLMENIKKEIQALEDIRLKEEASRRQKRTEGFGQQVELERYMRRLVHAGQEERNVLVIPEELNADACHKMQTAVLIPDLYIEGNEIEENFRLLTAKNICMGLVDARRKGITFVDRENRLVIAFFTDMEETGTLEQVQGLCAILEDESSIKPRIVLGSEVSGLQNLHVSYNDALYLLEQEREGFRKIVRPDKEKNREQLFRDVYQEMKKEMSSNLAKADYVMHVFENLKSAAKSYNLSNMQVQKCCFESAAEVYFTYVTETGEAMENKLEGLAKSLAGADRETAFEVTAGFIHSMIFRENSEEHEIITKARRYIDENLGGELSVANLAEQFFVSPNYFSRLFKKVMGEGCNEYIVKKRIEKSRLLLETTTIKAGKIAAMVGYNDTNYFSLAFKKHTGMSPIKYREMVQSRKGV